MPGYSLDNKKVSELISARYSSLREASKAMGISHSYLSKILAGKREPGKKFIDGILVALKGVKFEEIFVEADISGKGV
ncbi:MAG: helix-turn-helix domain-containing protein [Bacillota bacterium]